DFDQVRSELVIYAGDQFVAADVRRRRRLLVHEMAYDLPFRSAAPAVDFLALGAYAMMRHRTSQRCGNIPPILDNRAANIENHESDCRGLYARRSLGAPGHRPGHREPLQRLSSRNSQCSLHAEEQVY